MKRLRSTFLSFLVALCGCDGSVVHLPATEPSATPTPVVGPVPAATARAEIFIDTLTPLSSDNVGSSLNVFSASAVGNVAPIVHRALGQNKPFAADEDGSYWQTDPPQYFNDASQPCIYPSGVSRHALSGAIVQQILEFPCTTVVSATKARDGELFVAEGSATYQDEFSSFPCDTQSTISVDEFAATASGQAQPLQEFSASTAYLACSLYSLAVTSHGTVWLSGRFLTGDPFATVIATIPFIYEIDPKLPAGPSPLHSIALAGSAAVGNVAVDEHDDLYYLMNGALYRARPDGSDSQVVLVGPSVGAFTLGDGGNIIAEIKTGTGIAVQEYVPGRPLPIRVIAGAKTGLDPATFATGYNFIAAVP